MLGLACWGVCIRLYYKSLCRLILHFVYTYDHNLAEQIMDIKKDFGTDKRLEEEGVVFPFDETSSITVCRIGNDAFVRGYRRKVRKYESMMRRGKQIPDQEQTRIMIELYVEHIIKDWHGMQLDGEELPYSPENAKRMLEDYPDFRRIITDIATDMGTFQAGDDKTTEEELSDEAKKT